MKADTLSVAAGQSEASYRVSERSECGRKGVVREVRQKGPKGFGDVSCARTLRLRLLR